MKTLMNRFGVVYLFLLLSACAQTPSTQSNGVEEVLQDMELTTDRTVDSIRDYRINGWRYVDRHHVILTAQRRENYLVSFTTPCLGLSGAFGIGFTSTAGGVTPFDNIVVRGPGSAVETCSIKEIVRLKDSE